MTKHRCFECGNTSGNWKYYKSKREYKGEGYCLELDVEAPYCEKCGAPIYDKKLEHNLREKAHTIIIEQVKKWKEQQQ